MVDYKIIIVQNAKNLQLIFYALSKFHHIYKKFPLENKYFVNEAGGPVWLPTALLSSYLHRIREHGPHKLAWIHMLFTLHLQDGGQSFPFIIINYHIYWDYDIKVNDDLDLILPQVSSYSSQSLDPQWPLSIFDTQN